MLNHMLPWRKKKDVREQAAEIIAKYQTKQEQKIEIFTELQEEKRRQLGLHPTLRPDSKEVQGEITKDPLTKRQRALLEELGLNPKQED